MPPSEHSCIRCRTELSVPRVSDVPDDGDATEVPEDTNATCPQCDAGYRVEPADRGVRVYPVEGQQSLSEMRLATLREYAAEQGLVA